MYYIPIARHIRTMYTYVVTIDGKLSSKEDIFSVRHSITSYILSQVGKHTLSSVIQACPVNDSLSNQNL